MTRRPSFCLLAAAALAAAPLISAPAVAQNVVVPNDRAATAGTGVFLGPLTVGPRTYQLLVDESQLTGLLGQEIVGVRWRLGSGLTAAYPPADTTIASFDIRLSAGVDPSARSLTFANNAAGPQTLVRSGPLTLSAGAFPVTTAPHPFGPVIGFSTGYTYTGGDLLLELRHTGLGINSASVDAITTSTVPYGTGVSAAWQSSYTATTGSQGNAIITEFVVPEPAAIGMAGVAAVMLVARRRRPA